MEEENGKPDDNNPARDGESPEPKPEVQDKPKEVMVSPLDEAKAINTKKEELLEREEKLMAAKEKMLAEERVGGRASAGGLAAKAQETAEEKAARFDRGELDILEHGKGSN